jgi:hypothetical protein
MFITKKKFQEEISSAALKGFVKGITVEQRRWTGGKSLGEIFAVPADISVVNINTPPREAKDVVRPGDMLYADFANSFGVITTIDDSGVYFKTPFGSNFYLYNEIKRLYRYDYASKELKCVWSRREGGDGKNKP